MPPRPGEGGGELQGEQAAVPVLQAPAPEDGPQEEQEEPGQEREVIRAEKPTLTDHRYRGIVTFDWAGAEETQYMHLFTASAWTGELAECNEGDLEWVPKEKVYSLPIWEGDKIFFRLLEEERPFFSLKLSYNAQNVLVRAALDGKELAL